MADVKMEPLRQDSNRYGKAVGRILCGAVIFGSLVLYYTIPLGHSKWLIVGSLALFYTSAIWALRTRVRVQPSFATATSIEVLFLFFFFLIFYWPYQQYLLAGVSLDYNAYLLGDIYSNQTNKALLLSNAALLSFQLGIRCLPPVTEEPLRPTNEANRFCGVAFERQLTTFLAAGLVVLVTAYLSLGLRAAGEGRYTESASGGAIADGLSTVILMLAMMSFALFVSIRYQQRRPSTLLWLAFALSTFWMVRLLIAGDRNSFMLLAIVLVGGIYTYLVRAGLLALAATSAVAVFIYSVAEKTREGLSLGAAVQDIFAPAISRSSQIETSSFSITTITLRAGLAATPSFYEYGWGWFKVIGFGGVIPLIRGLFVDPESFSTTSQVVTSMLLPPDAGWDVGTNLIADIYLDFSPVGVPVIFFGLGLFALLVQRRVAHFPDRSGLTVYYLVVLALFAELPRYALDFPIRILIWSALLLWVSDWLSRRLHRPGSSHREAKTEE